MKKIIAIIFVCLFTSCAARKDVLPNEFFADVIINVGGKEFCAVYEKRTEFDKLTFSSPERLSGLDLTLENGTVTVKIGETVFDSTALVGMFDFLPIEKNEIKTVGNREYTVYNIRGAE